MDFMSISEAVIIALLLAAGGGIVAIIKMVWSQKSRLSELEESIVRVRQVASLRKHENQIQFNLLLALARSQLGEGNNGELKKAENAMKEYFKEGAMQ